MTDPKPPSAEAMDVAFSWIKAKLGDTTDETLYYGSVDLHNSLALALDAFAEKRAAEARSDRDDAINSAWRARLALDEAVVEAVSQTLIRCAQWHDQQYVELRDGEQLPFTGAHMSAHAESAAEFRALAGQEKK